jgi:hypothetical protein
MLTGCRHRWYGDRSIRNAAALQYATFPPMPRRRYLTIDLSALVGFLLRRFWLFAAAIALLTYGALFASGLAEAPIRSDGYSYYVYLPAWWLYHDPTLDSVARDCCGGEFPEFTAVARWPETGRWIDAHPIGVALLMTPFFGAAHALTQWSNLPREGFSTYYQHGAGLAGLAYFIAGLAMLRRLLSRHFSDGVTLATLVGIVLGTNLFNYGVYESTFSHAFSFFLVTTLMALTEAWWERPAWPLSAALGGTAAIIALVRHPNVVFLLMVPLYGVAGGREAGARIAELWRRRRQVAAMTAIAIAGVAPQLAIYKQATGHWLVSAYGARGFMFSSPHLYGVLFSVQKGLFFWSPLLTLAIVGLVVARGWARQWRVAAMVILAVDTYLIASWFDWQYGGSFGHRGFTDALPLFAVFLAAFLEWTAERAWRRRAAALVVTATVLLSVAQMVQYWMRVLPIADTTWAQYTSRFLQFR